MSKPGDFYYRFRVGDTVQWVDSRGHHVTEVCRRCCTDESYDLMNGYTCPGYAMTLVRKRPRFFRLLQTLRAAWWAWGASA